jgi:phage baseplate assembly protein W
MSSNKGLGTVQLTEYTNSTAVFVDQKKLAEDIKFMIKTPRGSILGNPEYGSDVLTMLYMPGTRATQELIESAVYDVLTQFNGVTVKNVSSSLSANQKNIIVRYDIIYNSVKVSNELSISTEGIT